MTVFTIIYGNYGEFLDNWIKNIKKQTIQPKEIIVILGKNHNVDKSKYSKFIKFIEYNSDVMGELRNQAIKNKKYKKCLYFSVDDELLPTAINEIEKKFNQGYKVVGLKFIDRMIVGSRLDVMGNLSFDYVESIKDSYIPNKKEISNWRSSNVPGYIAINGDWEYEPIEVPNYPYLFKLAKLELPMAQTDEVVAIYKRRNGSHGDIAKKGNHQNKFADIINSYL